MQFVQKTITKNGSITRGTVVFWSLNLQKMDKFYKICPKNHYKKRLYPPRDSRFLEFIDFSHIHFVILQHYGVILTN